jgi:hypothetical protein
MRFAIEPAGPARLVDGVDTVIPPSPPAEVFDAMGVAAQRVEALEAAGLELHFEREAFTGRVIVQVRDRSTGDVLRTISPSAALEVLAGGAL